ncbi:MAG: preprotein translocase subunit YajC [Bdellovibrionales bacterium]
MTFLRNIILLAVSFLECSPSAFAQTASGAAGPNLMEQMVPFVVIFGIFYFHIIRPQSKRNKDHLNFLTNMKRGDSVITSGGIYGKIEGITEKFVTLEISEGVDIRILKSQIASTVNDGAASEGAKNAK